MQDEQIMVLFNGREFSVPSGSSLADLLSSHGVDTSRALISRNGNMLEPDILAEESVSSGDRIEIMQFVGGG